ncbi:inhibin beta B chain [Anguilla anguilla]|uniref:inhibin beta B chain n=1 Tax=Anguilla anguilla TaxID=7936 RepID=UPI0015AFE923|nr:inhibin beta B chain [Anguilla anguilla]
MIARLLLIISFQSVAKMSSYTHCKLHSMLLSTLLVLAVLVVEILAAVANGVDAATCGSCEMQTIDKGSEEKLLIEIAKQQILSKLHLKERPNITQAVPRAALLTALRKLHAGRVRQDGTFELENNRQSARAKDQGYEVVSFADTDDPDSNSVRRSLTFQFVQEREQNMQVLQSALWLYVHAPEAPSRDSRATAQIYLSGQGSGNRTLLLQKTLEVQRGGWHTFPITHALQAFLDGGQRRLRLEALCDGPEGRDLCAQEGGASESAHRPFLVAQVRPREEDESGHARGKRSLRCGEDVSICCKKDFYIKFRDIEWHEWIIAPEGYHMNYCMGKCPPHLAGSPGIASSFHATVLSQLKANGIHTVVSSCCAPIQRRPLSMVYFNSQHSIVKTDVPDMIVESCGCT